MIAQLISSALLTVGTLMVFASIRAVIGKSRQRRGEAADAVARAIGAGEAVAAAAPDPLAAQPQQKR